MAKPKGKLTKLKIAIACGLLALVVVPVLAFGVSSDNREDSYSGYYYSYFGDSITAGYNNYDDSYVRGFCVVDGSYPNRVASALGMTEAPFACVSYRTNEVLRLLGEDVEDDDYYVENYSWMTDQNGNYRTYDDEIASRLVDSKVITLQIGGNDLLGAPEFFANRDATALYTQGSVLWNATYALKLMSYMEEAQSTYQTNYVKILDKLCSTNDVNGTIVIVGLYNPYRNENWGAYSNIGTYVEEMIQDANAFLKQEAEQYGCVYVDITDTECYSTVNTSSFDPLNTSCFDDNHPTANGNEYIAQQIVNALPAEISHKYYEEVVAPTCEEQGYTRHYCLCGYEYHDTYVDPLGSVWGDASYTWSSDNTSCTASRTCSRCGETQTVEATVTVTKSQDGFGVGTQTNTATFDVDWATAQTKSFSLPITGMFVLSSVANSNLVLDAAENPPSTGANVSVWSANCGTNQLWTLQAAGEGTYMICSVADTNLVLDAAENPPASGANISVWTRNGGTNQQWTLEGDSTSGYVIRSVANTDLVLDASGNPPATGSNVSAWTYNGGNNQKWLPTPATSLIYANVTASNMMLNVTGSSLAPNITVSIGSITLTQGTDYTVLYDGATTAPSAAGTYTVTIQGAGSYSGTKTVGTMTIINPGTLSTGNVLLSSVADSDFVLDAAENPPSTGANVSVWSYNGGANQEWNLVATGKGTYLIRSAANSGLVLDAAENPPASGANISAWTANGGANQEWILDGNATSGYVIRSAANTNLVLDAAGNPPEVGSNVSVWSYNGGNNQKWIPATATDLTRATVTASNMTLNTTGSALTPSITVTKGSTALTEGTDYTVLYDGLATAPIEAGSYKVTIQGAGSYTGTVEVGTMMLINPGTLPEGEVVLSCVASPLLVLDAAGNPPSTGSNVSVWSANGGANQNWTLEATGNGTYLIRSVADSNLVLDAAENPPSSGANISAWTANGGANQEWILDGNATSGYVIRSAANTNLVLDAAENPPSVGSNVSVWTANGGNNQKWTIGSIDTTTTTA